jgi:hypothetical protein
VGNNLASERPLMIEVELLERLALGESRGADADLAAVRLSGGDLSLETCREELLVTPSLLSSTFTESVDGLRERRCLEGPTEIGEVGGGFGGRHHATPVARS